MLTYNYILRCIKCLKPATTVTCCSNIDGAVSANTFAFDVKYSLVIELFYFHGLECRTCYGGLEHCSISTFMKVNNLTQLTSPSEGSHKSSKVFFLLPPALFTFKLHYSTDLSGILILWASDFVNSSDVTSRILVFAEKLNL